MQLLGPLGVKREADEPAAVLGHEIDGIGGGHLRRDDEVALVLPLLGIDQDEHPPVAGVLDHLLDGGQRQVEAGLTEHGHGRRASLNAMRST